MRTHPLQIDQIITAPVDVFCQMSGLGLTKVWEMIGDGTLASVRVGKRRLVVIDSWRRYIDEHTVEIRHQPKNDRGSVCG